jgi:hypothetical protein
MIVFDKIIKMNRYISIDLCVFYKTTQISKEVLYRLSKQKQYSKIHKLYHDIIYDLKKEAKDVKFHEAMISDIPYLILHPQKLKSGGRSVNVRLPHVKNYVDHPILYLIRDSIIPEGASLQISGSLYTSKQFRNTLPQLECAEKIVERLNNMANYMIE